MSICEHFDSSVDAGNRYYKSVESDKSVESVSITENWSAVIVRRVYDVANFTYLSDLGNSIVNSSCLGESPGKKLDQCRFNGYLRQLLFWKIWTHQNSDL